jgi:hypothetical protein
MTSERTIAQTARKFASALTKSGDTSRSKAVIESTIKKLGGVEAIGGMIADDIRRCRGEYLDDDQAAEFEYKDAVIQKYYSMLLEHARKVDEEEQVDLSALTSGELVESLRTLAIEMARGNQEFRRFLVHEALKSDPELKQEILKTGGVLIDVAQEKEDDEYDA